jgi:hypothetical protein
MNAVVMDDALLAGVRLPALSVELFARVALVTRERAASGMLVPTRWTTDMRREALAALPGYDAACEPAAGRDAMFCWLAKVAQGIRAALNVSYAEALWECAGHLPAFVWGREAARAAMATWSEWPPVAEALSFLVGLSAATVEYRDALLVIIAQPRETPEEAAAPLMTADEARAAIVAGRVAWPAA